MNPLDNLLRQESKRVLIRVDHNVPVNTMKEIQSDFRIKKTIKTIEALVRNKHKVIILSHFGSFNPECTMKPIVNRLSKLLNKEINYIESCVGEEVYQKSHSLLPGEIMYLGNVRLHCGEVMND